MQFLLANDVLLPHSIVAALYQHFRACFGYLGLCGDNDVFFSHGALLRGRIIRAPRETCLLNQQD